MRSLGTPSLGLLRKYVCVCVWVWVDIKMNSGGRKHIPFFLVKGSFGSISTVVHWFSFFFGMPY